MAGSDLRTPVSRACGLGSAKSGTAHWWAQRVTAIALFPLMIFLLSTGIIYGLGSYQDALKWLSYPAVSVGMIVFLVAGFYHAMLGLRVILEDYVHQEGLKIGLIILVNFICFVSAVTGIFSVLKIALS